MIAQHKRTENLFLGDQISEEESQADSMIKKKDDKQGKKNNENEGVDIHGTDDENSTIQDQKQEDLNIVNDLKNTLFLKNKIHMEIGFARAKTANLSKAQLQKLKELGSKNFKEEQIEEMKLQKQMLDNLYEEGDSPNTKAFKKRLTQGKEGTFSDQQASTILQQIQKLKRSSNIDLPEFLDLKWIKRAKSQYDKLDSSEKKKKNFKHHLLDLIKDNEVVNKLHNKVNLQKMLIKLSQDEVHQKKNKKPIYTRVIDPIIGKNDKNKKHTEDYILKKQFVRTQSSFNPQAPKFSFKEEFSRQFDNQNIESALKNFLKNSKTIKDIQSSESVPFALRNFSSQQQRPKVQSTGRDSQKNIQTPMFQPIQLQNNFLSQQQEVQSVGTPQNMNRNQSSQIAVSTFSQAIPQLLSPQKIISRNAGLKHQHSEKNLMKRVQLNVPEVNNTHYSTHRGTNIGTQYDQVKQQQKNMQSQQNLNANQFYFSNQALNQTPNHHHHSSNIHSPDSYKSLSIIKQPTFTNQMHIIYQPQTSLKKSHKAKVATQVIRFQDPNNQSNFPSSFFRHRQSSKSNLLKND